MTDPTRIVCDPEVLGGKPVISGTRISVELVRDHLGHGDSVDDLLADYPHLSREQVRAALLFASEAMGADRRPPYRHDPRRRRERRLPGHRATAGRRARRFCRHRRVCGRRRPPGVGASGGPGATPAHRGQGLRRAGRAGRQQNVA